MAVESSRRTPLGHVYATHEGAAPVDWRAAVGDRVHRITGGAGTGIRLVDLTPYQRFGLKGRGACDWLKSKGLEPPERINTSVAAPPHGLDILRLGTEDVMLLSRPGEPSMELHALRTAWEQDPCKPKGFDSWRDEVWAWFHISGENSSGFLAKTCPVDLHPDRVAVREIVQTRVAQMDCVLVRTDRAAEHGFDLFFDIASSDFMLSSLKDLGPA